MCVCVISSVFVYSQHRSHRESICTHSLLIRFHGGGIGGTRRSRRSLHSRRGPVWCLFAAPTAVRSCRSRGLVVAVVVLRCSGALETSLWKQLILVSGGCVACGSANNVWFLSHPFSCACLSLISFVLRTASKGTASDNQYTF